MPDSLPPEDEIARLRAENAKRLVQLENELGVKGIRAVFRKSMALAKEAVAAANADAVHKSELLAAIARREQQDAADMPDERAALAVMHRAFDRLRKLGWTQACYCPKDGSTIEVIEAGSTGIHKAHYEGKWPNGSFWIHEDGDLWPSQPILFRIPQATAPCGRPPKGEDPQGLSAEQARAVGEAEAPSIIPHPLHTHPNPKREDR